MTPPGTPAADAAGEEVGIRRDGAGGWPRGACILPFVCIVAGAGGHPGGTPEPAGWIRRVDSPEHRLNVAPRSRLGAHRPAGEGFEKDLGADPRPISSV